MQNNHNNKLSFTDCNFENNKAKAFGGALYINYDLDVTIINCVFNSNLGGDGQGAAIFIAAKDMSVSITDCNFKDNADFEDDKIDGFAIRSQASSLDISGCRIEYTDIITSISGLQIESTSNSASINNCHFIKCSGAERTSFVIECQNTIVFTNNYIDSCSYDENLGKIFIFGDATEQAIISCHFTNNVLTKSSLNSGLLIQKQQTQGNFNVRYESCEFMSNSASIGSGGALILKAEDVNDLEKTISVTMAQCTFNKNNADINGGALCVSCATSISISNSDFVNNCCNSRGGAIYIDYSISESSSSLLNDNSYCTITSCKFERNKASEYGNAIFVHELRQNAVYEIQNNNFIDNYFEESNGGHVIVASYYNINTDQNTFSNQNTNIPVNKFFLLSSVPSKSPSQSPSQTPKPKMTVIPGTNDNYINK